MPDVVSPLTGDLQLFPLDVVLGMLADAGATGTLEISGPAGNVAGLIEVTAGRVTSCAHGALRGASAIAPLVALESGAFQFAPGATARPSLVAGEDLQGRARAARAERAKRPAAPPAAPSGPGPDTLRLRSVAGALRPLVQDPATTAVTVDRGDDLDLGPAHERLAQTPDPLWSPTHLASLLNALLFGYLGSDETLRARELESLFAAARAVVPGAPSAAPAWRGSIDLAAVERSGDQSLVPVLQEIISRLFESDDAVHEGDHAKRVLLAAVERTLGPDAKHARDALRLVGAGSRLRARLSGERGVTEGPFELDEREHRIGRSSSNEVRIDHGSVSRRHARLVPRAGRFVLMDVGSTAGTKVDGETIESDHVLRGGETIGLGDVLLRFEYVEI